MLNPFKSPSDPLLFAHPFQYPHSLLHLQLFSDRTQDTENIVPINPSR